MNRSAYMTIVFSLFLVIRSQLPVTQTPDNSNHFLFPLKVRVIGIRLYKLHVHALKIWDAVAEVGNYFAYNWKTGHTNFTCICFKSRSRVSILHSSLIISPIALFCSRVSKVLFFAQPSQQKLELKKTRSTKYTTLMSSAC